MTVQLEKPVAAETGRKALVYISDLRTCQGQLLGFRFMRCEPRLCSVLTCTHGRYGTRAVLCASNKLGMCNSHTKQKGGTGYQATHMERRNGGRYLHGRKTRRFTGE